MKILLITNLFQPHARGGAERVVETIADALVANGHEVVIVTTQREGEHVEDGKYRVYRFRPENIFWYGDIEQQSLLRRAIWRIRDLYNYSAARRVGSIMFKEHPHVVMTHNLVGMGYMIPAMFKRFRARHVHTIHDVQLVVPSGQLWYNMHLRGLHRLYAWMCRRRFGSPVLVVSPSQWLLDFYTSRGFFQYSNKIILQNPIAKIQPIVSSEPKKDSSELRLLFVGQLEKHKGILSLIKAIKNLPISLDIVGSGSLFDRVRSLTRNDSRITVHGAVAHNALSEFYNHTDVVVVPSLVCENQPTVILEAFAHGVPVLAGKIGGIPELINHGVTGWLVEPGDGDALARQIHNIAQNKKILPTMQAAIRARLVAPTPEEYVTRLLDAVSSI